MNKDAFTLGYMDKEAQEPKKKMEEDITPSILQRLRKYEGFRPVRYWDKNAYSVGYGSQLTTPMYDDILTKHGLTRDLLIKSKKKLPVQAAEDMMKRYYSKVVRPDLDKYFEHHAKLPHPARLALTDMAYNLGYSRLSTFKQLKNNLNLYNKTRNPAYLKKAAAEIKSSQYYSQVGKRAQHNRNLMLRSYDIESRKHRQLREIAKRRSKIR